jgi:hypothetical protein
MARITLVMASLRLGPEYDGTAPLLPLTGAAAASLVFFAACGADDISIGTANAFAVAFFDAAAAVLLGFFADTAVSFVIPFAVDAELRPCGVVFTCSTEESLSEITISTLGSTRLGTVASTGVTAALATVLS